MKTRTWFWVAGLAATLIATVWATGAFAQGYRGGSGGSMPYGTFGPRAGMVAADRAGPGYGRGPGNGVGGPATSLIAVAADTLGMTQADLGATLGNGKTIAQVATERNVDPATIVETFIAPRAARINANVEAGLITRAQADQMLATMRANVTARINQPYQPNGPGFVDEDGDGVCDHAGAGRGGPGTGRRGP